MPYLLCLHPEPLLLSLQKLIKPIANKIVLFQLTSHGFKFKCGRLSKYPTPPQHCLPSQVPLTLQQKDLKMYCSRTTCEIRVHSSNMVGDDEWADES